MFNPGETSVLSKWLEQRLKEYFAGKSRGRKFMKDDDYNWLFSLSDDQSNGVPIQAAIFDFRILDLKLESESEPQSFSNKLLEENKKDQKVDAVTKNKPCKHQNTYVWLVYQQGSQCVGKELRLHMYASQFEQMKTNSPFDDRLSSIKSYTLSLDEHQIDVYTKVIPILKEWASFKKFGISFPVPECYYGRYESEEKPELPSAGNKDEEDEIILAEDDIMSKVAAGMEIFEREKKIRAQAAASNAPVKLSGSRLLILDDVYSDGYKPRNVTGSTFLSLMNVKEALKSLAAIHSISWAFCQTTGKSLPKIWPCLNSHSYMSYICDRVLYGYPVTVGLVREYLFKISGQQNGKEDQVPRILESLMKLRSRLIEILEGAGNPSTIQCLIHQNARFSSLLFRYAVLSSRQGERKGEIEREDEDNKNVKGTGLSSSNEPTKARQSSLNNELKREVMIINWRTASFGSPMIDVAFLLMTSLPPMTRRDETAALLRVYWNTFQVLHITHILPNIWLYQLQMHARKFELSFEYSEEDMFKEYLAALLYTCVLITGNGAIGCKPGDEGLEVFVEAVEDLIEAGLM